VPSLRNVILVDNSEGRIFTSAQSTTPFLDVLKGFESSSGQEIIQMNHFIRRYHQHPIHIRNNSIPESLLSHHSISQQRLFHRLTNGSTPSDISVVLPSIPLFRLYPRIHGNSNPRLSNLFPSESFNATDLQSIQEESATASTA